MKIVDYDPSLGQAFQGDVSIIPIPAGIAIATHDEIKPIDGRLIIQEGEVSGHHHAIDFSRQRQFRQSAVLADPVLTPPRDSRLHKAFGGRKEQLPTAKLYRDPNVAAQMQAKGILSRANLAIAALVVEGGPMVVSHEEHDGIRVPPGRYLVGRQVESAGAEERRVED